MSYFDPQNPGIGGIKELTDAEVAAIAQIAGLGVPGEDAILFYDVSNNSYEFLYPGTALAISGNTINYTGIDTQIVNIYNEFPVDTKNGINTLFTTVYAFNAGTTRLYVNGQRQALGTDYTESSSTQVTLTVAPVSDDVVFIDYEQQNTAPTSSNLLFQDGLSSMLLQDGSQLLLQI